MSNPCGSSVCLTVTLGLLAAVLLSGAVVALVGLLSANWADSAITIKPPINYRLDVSIGLFSQTCRATKLQPSDGQPAPGLFEAIVSVVDTFVPVGQMAEDKCGQQMKAHDLSYLSSTACLIIIGIVCASLACLLALVGQCVRHWAVMSGLAAAVTLAFVLQLAACIVFITNSKDLEIPKDSLVSNVEASLGHGLLLSLVALVLYLLAVPAALGCICAAKTQHSNNLNRVFAMSSHGSTVQSSVK